MGSGFAATFAPTRGLSQSGARGRGARTPMRRANLTALLTRRRAARRGRDRRRSGASPPTTRPSSSRRRETCSASRRPSRPPTLKQLQSLGVHALRVVLYWRNVAPNPNHRHRPSFNQANPAAYHWGAYDQLINKAAALHWKILLTVTGPVPRWATPHGEDIYSSPSTSDFALVHEGGRQALRRAGEALLDLERAEPAGLPATAVRPRAARLAGDLPRPVPGRLRGARRRRGTSPA